MQYVLGGISKLGGISTKAIENFAKGIDKAFLRVAVQLAGNAASEGVEEALQTVLEPFFMNIGAGLDINTLENVEWSDVLYNAILGMVTALLMDGASVAVTDAEAFGIGKDIVAQNQVESLLVYANTLAEIEPERFAAVADAAAGMDAMASAHQVGKLVAALSSAGVDVSTLALWSARSATEFADAQPTASDEGNAPMQESLTGNSEVTSQNLFDDVDIGELNSPTTKNLVATFKAGMDGKKYIPESRAKVVPDPKIAELTEIFKAGMESRKYEPKSDQMTFVSTSSSKYDIGALIDNLTIGQYNTGENKMGEYSKKVYSEGRRNEKPLTENEIDKATSAAVKQGYKGLVVYSEYSNTSFHGSTDGEKYCYLVIGTDAYPIVKKNGTANERITLNACMAHEIVGHYETWIKGTVNSDVVLDEVQASIRAAKFGVDLSQEERTLLWQDAMDRLHNAGVLFDDIQQKLDIWER